MEYSPANLPKDSDKLREAIKRELSYLETNQNIISVSDAATTLKDLISYGISSELLNEDEIFYYRATAERKIRYYFDDKRRRIKGEIKKVDERWTRLMEDLDDLQNGEMILKYRVNSE